MAGVFQYQQQEQQQSIQNLHCGEDKDSFKVDDATREWPFTTKIIPDPIMDWSKLSIYVEYTEDGLLIVPKKNGSINNSQEPTFSSKTALVLTKRKSEENDENEMRKGQTRLDNKITYVDGVSLMVSQSLGTIHDGDEAGIKFDYEECSKILMAANVETTTNWSTHPIYDEYPEDDDDLEELKLLTTRNAPQLHTPSLNVNSKKQKVDDWDWLDELVLKQRTRIFETYGVIRGSECSFVMDSGSAGNYVSENLVSLLNLSTEDLVSPYHVHWVNHEARTLVTK
ncbi:hypothetical protein RHSIM_Rhsim02G0135300 [Rhododendron simsii]|uniref:Uncharacterized protein n=1 Tax=Rhododendron simsii TaxID=118357 RepID=A0A834H8G1_RHOSS|nr:hypothetical protein RHSIM_Rhsim02G0135300 [Rhododendron simsii]